MSKSSLTLPTGVTFDARSNPGCESVENGKVRCRRDRLAVGLPASWQIAVRVRVGSATRGLLRSLAMARATEGDPTPSNNGRTATTTVIARSDLSIEKGHSRNSIVAGDGQPLTYTLRVRNAGPSDATQVAITDDLPQEVGFVSAPGCEHTGGRVTCRIVRLAAAASVAKGITVQAKPSARGVPQQHRPRGGPRRDQPGQQRDHPHDGRDPQNGSLRDPDRPRLCGGRGDSDLLDPRRKPWAFRLGGCGGHLHDDAEPMRRAGRWLRGRASDLLHRLHSPRWKKKSEPSGPRRFLSAAAGDLEPGECGARRSARAGSEQAQ